MCTSVQIRVGSTLVFAKKRLFYTGPLRERRTPPIDVQIHGHVLGTTRGYSVVLVWLSVAVAHSFALFVLFYKSCSPLISSYDCNKNIFLK